MNIIETNYIARKIDPRSFHVFTEQGEFLLFDRATAALLEISELLYEFFLEIEENFTDAEELLLDFDEAQRSEVLSLINDLLKKGFFRYIPVDHAEQEKLIEALWRHKPRRIQLLMAQGCNLGCRYCYAWRNGSNQKRTLMSFEMAKKSVDFLIARSAERKELQITFFGGEPLLNYQTIKEVVEYCKQIEKTSAKTFTFELITNGTLLDEEVVDFIVAHRFLLMISIDGWKEMHEHNRPSLFDNESHDLILKNSAYALQKYRENKLPEIKARANLTSRFHDSDRVREYLYSLGFSKVGISQIEPLSHSDPSPSAMLDSQVDEMLESEFVNDLESLRIMENGGVASKSSLFRFSRWTESPRPIKLKGLMCGVNRNTAVVDNRGNIYPCHRYEGMENYIVGNVLTGMDRERTMSYYRKVNGNATDRCHSCWLRDYCAGGCAWLQSAKDGNLSDPTESDCNRRRKNFERGLYLRSRLRTSRPEMFEKAGNRPLSELAHVETCASSQECGNCNSCS